MARLSDVIEIFIKEMLENADEQDVQIQRNELANYFSCAPSQINYVLTTRFTIEKGYSIESRRGGGGCINIKKKVFDEHYALVNTVNNKVGESITYNKGLQIINGLLESDFISLREADIIKVAINDRILGCAGELRNRIRAEMLKNVIAVVLR